MYDQYTEKFAYDHGSLGPSYHEVRIRHFLSARQLNFVCFQIQMLLRLTLCYNLDLGRHVTEITC